MMFVRVQVEGGRWTDGLATGRVKDRIRVAYRTLVGKTRVKPFSEHQVLTAPGIWKYLLASLPELRKLTCHEVRKYMEGTTCKGCGRLVEKINYRWHPKTQTSTPTHSWYERTDSDQDLS